MRHLKFYEVSIINFVFLFIAIGYCFYDLSNPYRFVGYIPWLFTLGYGWGVWVNKHCCSKLGVK